MTPLQPTTSFVLAAVSVAGLVWMMQVYYRRRRHLKWSGRSFGSELKETEFCIDKNLYLCNNGSFGAVPRQVLEQQKRLMNERERNPELWYRRQYSPNNFPSEGGGNLYQTAVAVVADFVGARPQDLVLVENATSATNSILKSLVLKKGDKILLTSHSYGSVVQIVRSVCEMRGCESLVVQIPVPIQCEDDIINLYAEALQQNPDIKLAVIDHITSCSAIVMPIEKLAAMCKAKGILVLIDGAHAPGHLPLKLQELPVDFYCGNLHKWLFAPRGCALLWIHPRHSDTIRHVVTSQSAYAATLMDKFCFVGTRGNIPYYVASSAIKFHKDLGGLDKITSYNSTLVEWAADMISKAWKTQRLAIPSHMRAPFMAIIAVPEMDRYPACDEICNKIMADVFYQSRVFAAFMYFDQRLWCRISGHVYNCREDYYKLRDAVLFLTKSLN